MTRSNSDTPRPRPARAPLEASPDATWLLGALRREPKGRAILRRLVEHCGRDGRTPSQASPGDVTAFLDAFGTGHEAGMRRRSVRWFYTLAFEAGRVEGDVAIAASVDELIVCRDHGLFLVILRDDCSMATQASLRHLARHLVEWDRSLLDAGPELLRAYEAQTTASVGGSTATDRSRCVRRVRRAV